MKNKTNTYHYHGRTFEVITVMCAGFHGEMAESHIYEVVRPNWKFFRTRWLDTRSFWIDTFDTIAQGEERMLQRVLTRECELNGAQKKWEEFLNN